MSSYTKGPWHFKNGEVCFKSDEDDQSFGMLCPVDFGIPENACLAAAAPELLDACRKAIYAIKGREHTGFLEAVIAKATGQCLKGEE